MRRNQRPSPLPSDPQGNEDIVQPEPRQHRDDDPAGMVPAPRNGARSNPAAGYAPEEARGEAASYPAARTHAAEPAASMLGGVSAQLAGVLVTVTGLWVAISPWFLTLQTPLSGNATVNNLIIGLAIAATGILATGRFQGQAGLPAATMLAGIWLIISPFVLAARFSITASMYWSNIWAGAIIVAASLAGLAAWQARAAR
ncbi:MAG: SPW repeat protein [Streptosporangiaceae bacterium]